MRFGKDNTTGVGYIPTDVLGNGVLTMEPAASGGILLQTDNVSNATQSVLNLIAGTNMTLTDDGLGGITLDATGGGSSSLTATYIGYGSGANALTGDANLTWIAANKNFLLKDGASTFVNFNVATSTFAYGDISNLTTGWYVGLDIAARTFAAGDATGVGNGTVLYLNDATQTSGLGDPAIVSNGTAFLVNDTTGTQVAGSQGQVGAVTGIGFLADYANANFALGDIQSAWNGTVVYVSDGNEEIVGQNGTGGMLRVSKTAGKKTTFGYRAMNAATTGTGNSAFGQYAGQLITDANNNSAFGASALTANTSGHANSAFGSGALTNLNDSGISNAEYNSAFGKDAGKNVTTGSYNNLFGYNTGQHLSTGNYNILIGNSADVDVSSGGALGRLAIGNGAIATADHQIMFGSSLNFYDTVVFGAGDEVNTNLTDVTLRINNSLGTNVAGRNIKYQSGLGTGTGGSGEHQWFTAPAGSTGSTLNTSTKVLSLDLNGNLRAYTLHNNATAQGSATQQDVRSGTYTPTVAGVNNITSVGSATGHWMRVGNVVTVGVTFASIVTAAATSIVSISLPVASNFGANTDAAGTGFPTNGDGVALMYADAASDLVYAGCNTANTGVHAYWCHFTYVVI